MNQETKKCTKCQEEKELDQFKKCKRGKYGLHSHCIECNRKQVKEYGQKRYAENPELQLKIRRDRYARIKAEKGKTVREYGKIGFDQEHFIKTCNESSSMAVACSTLGMSFTRFKECAVKLGCYKPNQGNKTNPPKIEKHITKYTSRAGIRMRIIKDKLIPFICAECNLGDEWNGKPIVLHLDHINGIASDHRLENLRFLCPNCHSQTDSYTGRNSKGSSRKTK